METSETPVLQIGEVLKQFPTEKPKVKSQRFETKMQIQNRLPETPLNESGNPIPRSGWVLERIDRGLVCAKVVDSNSNQAP